MNNYNPFAVPMHTEETRIVLAYSTPAGEAYRIVRRKGWLKLDQEEIPRCERYRVECIRILSIQVDGEIYKREKVMLKTDWMAWETPIDKKDNLL